MKKINPNHKYFIFILALYAALPPFAIDAYLPATPQIAAYFNIPKSDVIITVTTYFIGFALGMLIWGLFSDRFGRKKILITGMLVYVASTLICVFIHSFFLLKLMRFIQGLSDSSGAIVAWSILRDLYSGKKLISFFSTMVAAMMTAPIIAPIIGSALISSTGRWQSIFYFLSFYGLLLFILSLFLEETLKKKNRTANILLGFLHYKNHLKNKKFLSKILASSLCFSAIFSFIGSSAIIFLDIFSTGYVLYCILFSVNIIGIILANLYIKNLSRQTPSYKITSFGFASCFLGIMLCLLSFYFYLNEYTFTLGVFITTFGFSIASTTLRSSSLNIIHDGFGSANSLSSFIKFSFAGLANYFMSLYSINHIIQNLFFQQLFIIILAILPFYYSEKKHNE